VDVDAVLQEVAARGVNDVLVEAGPGLAGHCLARGLADELVIYQAPSIMGSRTMRMFETPAITSLADRKSLTISDVRRIGSDTRITATINSSG
jgi:diaminohydroxyphosphoribosylaminopyrimidine deaminase/5-amino-6-(5-phosphoribosylamino)uracil reductase